MFDIERTRCNNYLVTLFIHYYIITKYSVTRIGGLLNYFHYSYLKVYIFQLHNDSAVKKIRKAIQFFGRN